MSDTTKTLAICAGGAAVGLAISGGNPLGAVGGCLTAFLITGSEGCGGTNTDEDPASIIADGGADYKDVYIATPSDKEDRFANSTMATELWKVRPLTERLTAKAQSEEEAVVAVTQWVENNFFHYADFGEGRFYSPAIYNGNSEVEAGFYSISIEDIFRERVVGCHFASGVMITMLRSVGIAADYVLSENHGVTYLPSLDFYIHGDHLACLVCMPAEELLQNREELDYWAQHPGFPRKGDGPPVVSRGYLAFQRTFEEEYGVQLNLERTENTLHVNGYVLERGLANDFELFESAADICPEYNLRRDGIIVQSDFVPIRGIDEL